MRVSESTPCQLDMCVLKSCTWMVSPAKNASFSQLFPMFVPSLVSVKMIVYINEWLKERRFPHPRAASR